MAKKSQTPVPPNAKRLVQARRATGMNQRKFAAALGFGHSTYNNWERGKANMKALALGKLYHAFGIPADWIYHGSMVGMPEEMRLKLLRVIGEDEDAERRASAS